MRTTALIRLSLLVPVLVACDQTSKMDFGGYPAEMRTIASLKAYCHKQVTPIVDPISIQGTVTGNDLYGEFPNELVIEDASGGITIAANHASLADNYPLGCVVTIHCSGLVLRDYGGKIELGYAADDPTDPVSIPEEELPRYLRREHPEKGRPKPVRLTFSELEVHRMDTYIRFDGVRFVDPLVPWCDTDSTTGRMQTTEHTITDAQGRTCVVRTSGACTYATELVPLGTSSLCGILDYFNGKFALRITNREVLVDPVNAATPPTAYL